jgi:uncharacterized membrane protein
VTRNDLPDEAEAWLAAAEQALRHAFAEQTTEIMDGLRSHITEALARGEEVNEVLTRLGPPAYVADPVIEDVPGRRASIIKPVQVPATTPPQRPGIKGYMTAKRTAQVSSFALALLAAVIISLQTGYVGYTVNRETGEILSTTTQIALFNMDSKVAGTLVAALLLTAIPPFIRGRRMALVTACISSLLVILALATTIWIVGWFILPAAIAAVVATTLPIAPRDRRAFRQQPAGA